MLEFERAALEAEADNEKRTENLMWLGYCDFHAGAYDKALDAYRDVLASANPPRRLGCSLPFASSIWVNTRRLRPRPRSAKSLSCKIGFFCMHRIAWATKLR